MEPLDYCHSFNMLSSEVQFDRIQFLNALYKDFLDYYLNDRVNLNAKAYPTYERFTQIVNNYYQKYQSISRTRSSLREDHKGLTRNLWGYFYCHYIIPLRDKNYPEVSRIIYEKKRRNIPKIQDKNNSYGFRQLCN